MLDNFLENSIQKKLQLYQILRAAPSIEIKDIYNITNLNSTSLGSIIDELNDDFNGNAKIIKTNQTVSIFICDNRNTLYLLYSIYKDSDVLNCLRFMITNDDHKSFTEFMDDNFLSKSTAYRTKKLCEEYLKIIGLKINKNKVEGEEYRIRFLIALLYYKYGINCSNIDEESIQLARKFILATNKVIDLKFLENTQNEYGYFETLLILLWKRKKYEISFKKTNYLDKLKTIFIYNDMINYLKEIVEKELNLEFSENEYEYLFVAYCATNSCILADKWTLDDIKLTNEIICGNVQFKHLIQLLENRFKIDIQSNRAMRALLIYFSKKFIFNLQCIIPDKHFYWVSKRNPSTLKVNQIVTEILEEWRKENNIKYPIDTNHICCFSIQLETILRQFIAPVNVVIVSDLIIELEIMELALNKSFSSQKITITQFLLNSQKMNFLYGLKDSIIIVNHRLENILRQLDISKDNFIISISAEINNYDINLIQKRVEHNQKKTFLKMISDI